VNINNSRRTPKFKRKENKNILDNINLLLSDMYSEKGQFLNDNLRIALVNESIWLGEAFSKDIANHYSVSFF
jgi:hypothetical protein